MRPRPTTWKIVERLKIQDLRAQRVDYRPRNPLIPGTSVARVGVNGVIGVKVPGVGV